MKRKLLSYLFLTAGIALAFLLGGCVTQESPQVKLAAHTLYATQTELHIRLTGTVDQHEYNSFFTEHSVHENKQYKNYTSPSFHSGGSCCSYVCDIGYSQ